MKVGEQTGEVGEQAIFLFLEQIAPSCRHLSAWIHAQVGNVLVDAVTLRDQMVRAADFSQR